MKNTKVDWCEEQITLLEQLIPIFNSKKWKNISRVFKQRGFERSEIECREKWVNFFDPKIKSDDWSAHQLQVLYDSYQKYKTQWYLIEKLLPGRTQNKIKNRFYGSLRNFVRFIVRFFNKDRKSYSTQINRLSPRHLNLMYESQEAFQFLKGEFPKVIKDLGYLFDRSQFSKKVKENREIYFKVFQKLMDIFNQRTQEEPLPEIEEINEQQQIEEVEKNQGNQQNEQLQPQVCSNYPYMFPSYFFFYQYGSQ